MKKSFAVVAGLSAAALALTGCAASGDAAAAGDATAELRIGNFADLTSWDPALADIGFNAPYLSAVYDPLVSIDGTGQPQPALATGWTVSDDFLTITMDLRDDAVFADGTSFDAEAAVTNLEYLKEGTVSREAYLNVEGFAAVDADTVEIHLAQRDDRLLYFMGLGRSYMASPAAISEGTLEDEPSGSGPYTLAESTVPGAEYHFDRVEGHWAGDEFAYDRVVVQPIQDPTARNNAMEAGQLDVAYGDATAVELAEANSWNVASQVASWVGLRINDHAGAQLPALGDVRVRQALSYAFDGEAMLANIGQSQGVYTNQLFAVGFEGYVPELNDRYAHDLRKAKQLMTDAGYAEGFDVTLPMAPPFQPWQPVIEQVFSELNISVKWDEVQYADYQANAPTYPMFVAVLAVDSNPTATIARQITVPQWYMPKPDVSQFPELQAQVDRALEAAPGDAQIAEVQRLNTDLVEQAWNVVWYQSNNVYVSVSEVEVEPVTGMMFPSLRQIQPAD